MKPQLSFIRLTIAFIAGIILGDACCSFMSVWLWLVLYALSLAAYFVFRNLLIKGTIIIVSFCMLGGLIFSFNGRKTNISLPKKQVGYEGIVVSQPLKQGRVMRFDAVLTKIEGRKLKRNIHTKVTLFTDSVNRELRLGEGFEGCSLLKNHNNYFNKSNFDYERWTRVHDFLATTFVESYKFRSTTVGMSLSLGEEIKLKAMKIRQRLVEGIGSEISDRETLALLAAMSLGDKTLLGKNTKDEFSQSGASHVLALSGLHMSIIFAVLLLLFSNSFVGRILCILSLWFFVVLFGMPSSSVRAATMLSIYAFGSILHRSRKQHIHTLALSAFVILLFNPFSLWDVGFQMSFIAILSIFIYYKPFYDRFKPNFKPLRWLYASVCLSMAAQIGTAPLVAYYFGRFSCYFILTNIFVIPCTTAILYFMMLALVLLPIKVISLFMLSAGAYVVKLMYEMVKWVAQLPGSSIDGIHINSVQLIAIYLVIISITYLFPYYIKVRDLRSLRKDT